MRLSPPNFGGIYCAGRAHENRSHPPNTRRLSPSLTPLFTTNPFLIRPREPGSGRPSFREITSLAPRTIFQLGDDCLYFSVGCAIFGAVRFFARRVISSAQDVIDIAREMFATPRRFLLRLFPGVRFRVLFFVTELGTYNLLARIAPDPLVSRSLFWTSANALISEIPA